MFSRVWIACVVSCLFFLPPASEAQEPNGIEINAAESLALCYVSALVKTISVDYGVSESVAINFIEGEPSMQPMISGLAGMAALSAGGFYKNGLTVEHINDGIRENMTTSGIPPALAEGMISCNSNTLK